MKRTIVQENICEICGDIFVPTPRGVLPRGSGRVCDYCLKHYAAY